MDNTTAALARMNMILHDCPTAEIWKDNTLAHPHFKASDGRLKTFDFVVANPPFSNKAWTNGFNPEEDEFRRFPFGVPPRKNGEVAFLRFAAGRHCSRFFLYEILSTGGQERIRQLMSGNAITRLTLRKIRSLHFAVPKLDEQIAIASVLSDMDAEIAALEARVAKTRTLKQGMMQELLTGRIRLPVPA